jgi:lipoyl(octanoyl) transferase
MQIDVVNLGLIEYSRALAIQNMLVRKRKDGETGNVLLLLEHPAVITMGTRGQDENIYATEKYLKSAGISVVRTNRGGDVTYHGPGQIVGYPIFDLNDFNRDLTGYVRNMENALIKLLDNKYGIEAHYETGKYTGVWVGDKKIAAIGIAVVHAITMHGFAFNVNTNLEHFKLINPCGLSKGVTSVAELTGRKQNMEQLFAEVAEYFAAEYGCTVNFKNIRALIGAGEVGEANEA